MKNDDINEKCEVQSSDDINHLFRLIMSINQNMNIKMPCKLFSEKHSKI